MEQQDQIKSIVSKVWRVQYRMLPVPDLSFDKLFNAVQNKQPVEKLLNSAEGGSSFDAGSAWHIIYEAIDFAANVLAIFLVFKQKNETPPLKKEMIQLLREAKIENSYSRAVLDRLDILIDQIIKDDELA